MSFLSENWQLVALLFGAGGGGGWFGWLLSNKSRKIDLQRKAFQLNSEMIDAIRVDFSDRIKYLQDYINNLTEINKELDTIIREQRLFIQKQNKYLSVYRKKYGKLNEKEINTPID